MHYRQDCVSIAFWTCCYDALPEHKFGAEVYKKITLATLTAGITATARLLTLQLLAHKDAGNIWQATISLWKQYCAFLEELEQAIWGGQATSAWLASMNARRHPPNVPEVAILGRLAFHDKVGILLPGTVITEVSRTVSQGLSLKDVAERVRACMSLVSETAD